MSEEPLAHKNQQPSSPPDAEYDSIYATVAETAQGRRFLEEHARRSRPSETEVSLAALERMQMAMRSEGGSERLNLLLVEVAEMAEAIAQARAEIVAIKPPHSDGPFDATEELDAIVQTTEGATSRILAAAEQVQELAWLLRENRAGEDVAEQLNAQATEIYTACSFQDLTGQRTRKVMHVLRTLEDRINTIVGTWNKEKASEQAETDDPGVTDSLAQADVDVVMQPEATVEAEDRQDATLEDINRFMLALEPLMTLHQAAAAERDAEEKDAKILSAGPMKETRPELSVADVVMQEAEDAQGMAEWVVESATPAEAAVETAMPELPTQDVAAGAELEAPVAVMEADAEPPMAEWIEEAPAEMQAASAPMEMTPPSSVDEPQRAQAVETAAPKPEAEPAWMVLQRLQTTQELPQPESEAEAELSGAVVADDPVVAAAPPPPPEQVIELPAPSPTVVPERAEAAQPLTIPSVAPPQDELMARLIALLPPAELNFPKAPAKVADPLTEHAAALAATKIELRPQGEDVHSVIAAAAGPEIAPLAAENPLALAPQQPEATEPPVAETPIAAELPPAPEPQAVETAPLPEAVETPSAAVTAPTEGISTATDFDPDEFLFADETPHDALKPATPSETRPEEPGPADFLLEPAPQEAAPPPVTLVSMSPFDNLPPSDRQAPTEEAAQSDPLPAMEWKSGSFPDPALVTPQVVSASALSPLAARLAARAPHDPLAPLRALSDDEKIALFS
jgi:chemotaxis regulatin CheY-phosphate phosphatase CheZ